MNNPPSHPPRVSVVIPVYNMEDWIEETLASVLGQTYERGNLEIIIVDDGSTDRSVSLAKSILQSSPIPFVILKTDNRGPSRARNLGWRHAKGEWIQFLDADDVLTPIKIETQAQIAFSLPKTISVVYSKWQRLEFIDQRWEPSEEIVAPVIEHDPLMDLLKTENFLNLGCALFRKDWVERVSGFDERHWLIEDVDLLLRIAIAGGKFHRVFLDTPSFFYRQRNGSLSQSNSREFLEGCLRNAKMVETCWKSRNELTPVRASVLANIYFQGARSLAGVDGPGFEAMLEKIESLTPHFLPPAPLSLRWLSRLVGYRKAERLAVTYHRLKESLTHL